MARQTQGLDVEGEIWSTGTKGSNMVKRKFRSCLTPDAPKPVGINQGEPVEGVQASIPACLPCPPVMSSDEPTSLVDAPLTAKTKRLRLSAPAGSVKPPETNLAECPRKL